MATIKIQVSKKSEVEKEISLPCFRKTNIHYFKIISKEECVLVTDFEGHQKIQITYSGIAFSVEESQESNEEEFNAAFKKVNQILIDKAFH